MAVGDRLRQLRQRLGISTRGVDEYSSKIAELLGNEDYHISYARLTQIETSDSTPGIYKLFSLSVALRIQFADLLKLYGLDLDEINRVQTLLPLADTHVTNIEIHNQDQRIAFPIKFEPGLDTKKTTLLSYVIQSWGEVPISFVRNLDLRHSLYGFIGTADYAMYPLLRPGTLVQVDKTQTKVQNGLWKSEFERPIYFIELRDGFACSWCHLDGKFLTLVPHPLSGVRHREFSCPDDAEILGRVTGIAMKIAKFGDSHKEDSQQQLPKQT